MSSKLDPPQSLRIRVVLSIAICALLVGTGLAVAIGTWRKSAPTTTNTQLMPTDGAPAEIVRFTVYDAGIFPREARASAGVVALHFEDRYGGSAGLTVVNESLEAVGQVVRRPQRWRESARIALAEGRYTVYDTSRPLSRATLIIEP